MRISAFLYGDKDYGVCKNGSIYSRKSGKWIRKKISVNAWGYPCFGINRRKRTKVYKLHKVIADHFLCNKHNRPQVHHVDEDKKNNKTSNLKWVTNSENNKAKSYEKRHPIKKRLTELDVYRIFLTHRHYGSIGAIHISKLYGVSIRTASRLLKEIRNISNGSNR